MNILSEACHGRANKINTLEHVQVRQKFKSGKSNSMYTQHIVEKFAFVLFWQ